MRPSNALHQHREAVLQIVELHRATNPRVFGSVLHGLDTDHSDLDIQVAVTTQTTMLDIGAIRAELTDLLGVEVEVLTEEALPDEWKDKILREARPI
ncbi:nucleotidyltransferase domain-containing protein [Marinimicrobium agarilyticum]|uniref:nucleotidyltransferase domain-containing protein n=1 Tax=Marinimicrobium agarilyticum TaxID=306546 RepID=UPI000482DCD0